MMTGFQLLALCVALTASAQEAAPAPSDAPLPYRFMRLTPVTKTPRSSCISPDASMSAVAGENAITVWSLTKGKPLFRIEAPVVDRSTAKDTVKFQPVAFSGDGRWLLAKFDHRRSTEEGWVSNAVQLVLVSVTEEKIARTLTTFEGRCGVGAAKCVELLGVELSADGKHAVAWGERDGGGEGRVERFVTAVDFEGRRVHDEQEVWAPREPGGDLVAVEPNRNYRDFVGFAADGRKLGVGVDDGSCALLDLGTRRRIAFLDGCNERDVVLLRAEHGYLYSAQEAPGILKLWGYDGVLRARLDVGAHELRRYLVPLGDGRYAVEYAEGGNLRPGVGQPNVYSMLWDVKTGASLAAGTDLSLSEGYNARLTPDRRYIAGPMEFETVYAALDAGTPLARNAPALSAKVAAAGAATDAVAPTPGRGYDQPPHSVVKTDPDAYAVIIGIEKYRSAGIPAVEFAARDAKTMHAYATRAMGFDPKNTVLLTDGQASRADFEKYLGSWLRNRVSATSRVFVYYAGHGAPDPGTGASYLLPYEGDPSYLEESAFPVSRLYAALEKLPTKDVTVILDACFSGQGGRSLIAKGARPLVNTVAPSSPVNTVVLAAASGSQVSATDHERRHGLLTSYLLEALHGAADADGDRRVTSAEIYAFVRPAVERAARLQNVEQTPTITPSPDVLKARPGRPWLTLPPKR